MCVCVRACVRACVRTCVRVCVCVCVCEREREYPIPREMELLLDVIPRDEVELLFFLRVKS